MAVILVVEDDWFVRQSVEWLIGELGHRALMASDLAGALRHLWAPDQIDALFVDIRLDARAWGGCEIADRAIDLRPDLRVLYTSGNPLTAEMARHFVDGGRFLEKPYSFEHLGRSVDELLH
jgi:DNA-binding NtrC family response regulator